jgi:hypothetical protein
VLIITSSAIFYHNYQKHWAGKANSHEELNAEITVTGHE